MYRRNAAADWLVYPYYTKNFLGSNTDKRGQITIDTLALGEYVFAIRDNALGISENHTNIEKSIVVYPNPAKDEIQIDFKKLNASQFENIQYLITDISGKIVLKGNVHSNQQTVLLQLNSLNNGIYIIHVENNGTIVAKEKFVIAR